MVCPYLKNKGSAVRFCLWPLIPIIVFSILNYKNSKLGQELGHRTKIINMKKALVIFLLIIVACGGTSEETVVEDITTTTAQDITTTTVQDTTTTTAYKKPRLINSFDLVNIQETRYSRGYIAALVNTDVLWEDFIIETINKESEICLYSLNEVQVDYSRLLFIPEIGCKPGIYQISRILINYEGSEFIFESTSNDVQEYENIFCCNFQNVFNWKVEIKRNISNNCDIGLTPNEYCIRVAPEIINLNIYEEGNNVVIDYELNNKKSNGFDLDTELIFSAGFIDDKGESKASFTFSISPNPSDTSPETLKGNIWKNVIYLSRDSKQFEDFKVNRRYALQKVSFLFTGRDFRDVYCATTFELTEKLIVGSKTAILLTDPGTFSDYCDYSNYETVLVTEVTSSNVFVEGYYIPSYFYISDIDVQFEFEK